MLDRRALFASFAVVAMALPALADSKAFKSADFDKAKTSGKPVLVEVTAPGARRARLRSRSSPS